MEALSWIFVSIGATLLLAFILKYFISDRFKIPAVTIYIILGVLAGVSFFKVYPLPVLENLGFVSKLALGLIAFIIGSELDKNVLASLGRSIFFIALFEALLAGGAVFTAIYFFTDLPLYYATILGAVASATAPAATVYVIRQYKAKGPLTSTIMGVVGIDDAISLIIFVFASVFTANMLSGTHGGSTILLILKPFWHIGLSVVIGLAGGLIYIFSMKKIRDSEVTLMAIFGFILLLLGVSEVLDISELLTIMAFGAVLANANAFVAQRAKKALEILTPLLLPLFFIFAGARLNIQLIGKIGLIGLLYTGARMFGKIGGASLGAAIGKAPKVVKKWIGFALIPQVGVAVALALSVNDQFGKGAYGQAGVELAGIVINILLFTTIITEVVGPLLTKMALKKAGEIQE